MPDLQTTESKQAGLDSLIAAMRGTVLTPGDAAYEQAVSATWAGQCWTRRPAAIARCHNAADVAAAVRFSAEAGLEITVKGGGHNAAGFSTVDRGLIIDLAEMRAVIVRPEERRVIAQGGCRLGDVDHETQVFGLATPVGVNSNTGLGGLVLGGGIGWLQSKYGLAVDNALGFQLVTATGEIIWVDGEHHPDLFWALRGGGGNFGVVTAFELALHPVGPTVFGGAIFFGPDRIEEVTRWYRDWTPGLPDDLTVLADILTAPEAPFLPAEFHGQSMIGVFAVHLGTEEEAERALAPLRALADPVVDLIGPIPFTSIQQLIDDLYPDGGRYLMRSTFLTGLPDAAIAEILAARGEAPVAIADMHLHDMGGVTRRVDEGATAWPNRSAPVLLAIFAAWDSPDDDESAEAWADEALERLGPWRAPGGYSNYCGPAEELGAVRECYGSSWDRLVEVKAEWDPRNLFHVNQNVRPS